MSILHTFGHFSGSFDGGKERGKSREARKKGQQRMLLCCGCCCAAVPIRCCAADAAVLLSPSLRHPHWCHCAHKKRRAGVQLTNEIERMEAPNLPKYWNPDGTWNYDVPNNYKLSRTQEIYWALCRVFPDGKGGYDAAKCGNHNTVTGLSINHPGFGFRVLNIGVYGILIPSPYSRFCGANCHRA